MDKEEIDRPWKKMFRNFQKKSRDGSIYHVMYDLHIARDLFVWMGNFGVDQINRFPSH